jgi:hypothetical protein
MLPSVTVAAARLRCRWRHRGGVAAAARLFEAGEVGLPQAVAIATELVQVVPGVEATVVAVGNSGFTA